MKFRILTDEEAQEFRKWARENYRPFSDIKGIWHPIVQAECVQMNLEKSAHIAGIEKRQLFDLIFKKEE